LQVSPAMQPSEQPVPDQPPRRWEGQRQARLWPRRWPYRLLAVFAGLFLVSGSTVWWERERIAGNVIDNYLAQNDVAARYDIVAIGATRQVVANLVVGDPARPDLVAERVVIKLGVGLTGPVIDQVAIDNPRLRGTVRDGRLSLGALDPLIFTDSDDPARLPAINIAVIDGRARFDTDFGAIAARLDGAGRLDNAFTGAIALTAPRLGTPDCRVDTATMFGALTTTGSEVRFAGPIRLRGLECAGATLASGDIGSTVTIGSALDEITGKFALSGRDLRAGNARAAGISGPASVALSTRGVALEHDLKLTQVAVSQLFGAEQVVAKGTWRAGASTTAPSTTARSEWNGAISARGLAMADGAETRLRSAATAAAGTLAGPLLANVTDNLTKALQGAAFTSEAIIRQSGDEVRVIMPEARLRARDGEVILALSQINWGLHDGGARGNFLTGGTGLPRINGRIEEQAGGGMALRMTMADYAAADSRLAFPQLVVRQTRGGTAEFAGLLTASGALPGGRISGLKLPLEGSWSQTSGLLVGRRCADIRFDSLRAAQLDLAGRQLRLCPAGGAAMLRFAGALEVAAQTSQLALAGTLDGAPARLDAAQAILRYPGTVEIAGIDARLGQSGSEIRLTLASLTASFGAAIRGQFAGGAAAIAGLPFALDGMAGAWNLSDDRFTIDRASFTLADGISGQARFEPLAGKNASLTVAGSDIAANARLEHPGSGQEVATINLHHDLGTAAGRADIVVEGLTFGPQLDGPDLTYLVKGVVALLDGTVKGRGRVAWQGDRVTSSGRFGSDDLDFAAAFGPVRGVSGEIAFTDLLSLTTAPRQRLDIAAINTGVEVLDGQIVFSLTNGEIITVDEARWPFMGGQLQVQPVELDFGSRGDKRYVFEMTGLDAAIFVAEMDFSNITVTGIFDGMMPVAFDSEGNGRVEQGVLRARAGGGNVSYLGDLTYQDMGAITNFAFGALRSLDYTNMSVVLDGSLTGEIISRFEIDGVRQGEGAQRNFLTRRIARLPLQFRINVKAESFYELSTVVRSFWDADMLGSPVDRGLLRIEDERFVPAVKPAPGPPPPTSAEPPISAALRPDDNFVQPPESEDRP
jgi:translocation and assembly module TamB